MDGIHDLGGKQGYGAVATDDPIQGFQERWHAAVFAMVNMLFARGYANNVDHFRHAIERINPQNYLADGYYGRWLGAVEMLLIEADELDQAELQARLMALPGADDVVPAARPQPSLDFPPPSAPTASRGLSRPAKFSLGDRVVTDTHGVPGHTRLPAYARGAVGEVVALHDGWVFPDSAAMALGEDPQHLYTVRFSAQALFGEQTEAGTEICLDLFEPYLQECV